MNFRSLLIAFCLFASLTISGQSGRDSLWSIWLDTDQKDSLRVAALQRFTWQYFLSTDPDSAFDLAEMSYDFAHDRNLIYFMGYARLGQGVSYQLRGNKVKAVDLFLECISIFEVVNAVNGIAGALNNIGLIYFDLKEYEWAMEYHQRSLAMREQIGDGLGTAGSLNNMGDILMARGEYLEALKFYERSLAVIDSIGNKGARAYSLDNIGMVYFKLGENNRARSYFQTCLEIAEAYEHPMACLEAKVHLGEISLKMQQFVKAEEYCKDALEMARESENLDWQKHACECLYEASKRLDKSEAALHYLEISQKILDSLDIGKTYHSLQTMEVMKDLVLDSLAKAETERKIELLLQEEVRKRNRTRDLWIISGVISSILFVGLLSRLNYIRRSKRILEVEKDRSDTLLLNILPAEVAEELKKTGKASARHFDQVSILFTDFEGFTETSELLSAADLVAEINICFEEFDRICDAYEIEKIKTIGDAYMAAGGLPVPYPNSIRNTIMAALTMQEFIISRRKERLDKNLPSFEMRAGIHVGSVVAGIVGLKKFQYDVWGDTVNTANRMESYSDIGMVNISEDTYLKIKKDLAFHFKVRGSINVKGKGHMKMYYVFKK